MTALPCFSRPYDRSVLDDVVRTEGVAVLAGLLSEDWCARAMAEVAEWLAAHPDDDAITRGPYWLWVTSIAERMPFAADLLWHPELLGWAARLLASRGRRVRPVSAEYRARLPGETSDTSVFHRVDRVDTNPDPVSAQAIAALGAFTVHNGAPWFALRSQFAADVDPASLVRAELAAGDVVVFRSDVLHRIGANTSADEVLATVSVSWAVDRLC